MTLANTFLKKQKYSVNLDKRKRKKVQNIMMKKMRKRRRKSQKVKNHRYQKNLKRNKIRLLKIKIKSSKKI